MEISLSTLDIAARDQLLSDLLQSLAEVLASNKTLLFPQDLSTSNIVVENVVSQLREDIESRVASRLQIVRQDLYIPPLQSLLCYLYSFL